MNTLQTILYSLGFTTIDEKTALEALALEKFREDHRLTSADLLELAKTSTNPEWMKKFVNKLISYAETSETESHFTRLCTAFLLVNLALLHESTLPIILRNVFCLDVFLKDDYNFPTYLITLAEKYTFQIYAFLWMAFSPGSFGRGEPYYKPEEKTIMEKHKKLLAIFLNHSGNRSFRSQLVAFFDHVDFRLFNQRYSEHGFIHSIIADSENLIKGEDGKENLQIIIQSKQRAEYLLRNILSNMQWHNPSLPFERIPLKSIVQIGQQHPELAYTIVDAIVKNVVLKKKGSLDAYIPTLEILLPLLKAQADKEHASSQLSLARVLFTGISSQGQDLNSAVVLCQAVYERNNTKQESAEAIGLLIEFANAYYTGCFDRLTLLKTKESQDGSNILMAGALFEYAVAKREAEKAILSDPSFSLAYGKALEEDFNLDRAYFVYQRAELPNEQPKVNRSLSEDYNSKRYDTYCKAIFNYPFVKQRQLLVLANVLQDIKNNPQSSLQVAMQCVQKGQALIAAHLLVIINAKTLPSHRIEDFGEFCFKTAMQLITTHQQHHSLACELLTQIPAEAPVSYRSAQNLLVFANRSVNNHYSSQQQLARSAIIQILINHYEMLYETILNSQKIAMATPSLNSKKAQLEELERDTVLFLKQLQQELLRLQNPSSNLPSFKQHESHKKLPLDMQHEISAPPPLRDHHLPREISESQVRINILRRFSLAPERTKPPAQRWVQDNLGFWHKATRDTSNNDNNNNNIFCSKNA